jgi:general secretion pathway protein G
MSCYTVDKKSTKAKYDIEFICEAIERYRQDTGQYPTTEEGLEVLRSKYRTDGKPYLIGHKLDPWDVPYKYRCPGLHNKDSYDLWTYGADNSPSGELEYDIDIDNWSNPASPMVLLFTEKCLMFIMAILLICIAIVIYRVTNFEYTINKNHLLMKWFLFGLIPIKLKIGLEKIVEVKEVNLKQLLYILLRKIPLIWGKPSKKMVLIMKEKGIFNIVIISPRNNNKEFIETLKTSIKQK